MTRGIIIGKMKINVKAFREDLTSQLNAYLISKGIDPLTAKNQYINDPFYHELMHLKNNIEQEIHGRMNWKTRKVYEEKISMPESIEKNILYEYSEFHEIPMFDLRICTRMEKFPACDKIIKALNGGEKGRAEAMKNIADVTFKSMFRIKENKFKLKNKGFNVTTTYAVCYRPHKKFKDTISELKKAQSKYITYEFDNKQINDVGKLKAHSMLNKIKGNA